MGRELVLRSASNRPRSFFLSAHNGRGADTAPVRFRAATVMERFGNQGAVAQLGERLICIQEVAGSIPTSSTKFELLWL